MALWVFFSAKFTETDPMTKLLDRLRNEFQGSADLLIARAQELAKNLRLDQEGSEGNERLLRHYVSMGVVDKPSREGRDALYGFRHLLQFVAARRLLAEGYSLAKIAKYTAVVPTDALSDYLEKPGRASEAELLVAHNTNWQANSFRFTLMSDKASWPVVKCEATSRWNDQHIGSIGVPVGNNGHSRSDKLQINDR